MNFRYLEAFLSTAKHLSFTRAGEELGVTQAAVSRQIRLLEESLGQQLLVRSPQSVTLTPLGERLSMEGSKFQHWIDEELLQGIQTIRIAALQGIVENWMTELVSNSFKDAPLNFSIQTGTQPEIQDAIETGDVDIAIGIQEIQSESLTSFKLLQEKIVVISKKPIELKRLTDYPWITYDAETFTPYSKRKSKRILQVESMNAILNLVKKGAGISMLPSHLIRNTKGLKVYPIEIKDPGYVWATTMSYTQAPEHLNVFLKLLRNRSGQFAH